jgi:hypothetical protein
MLRFLSLGIFGVFLALPALAGEAVGNVSIYELKFGALTQQATA